MNERRTIQRIGFRKWYERELLRSHGHLVLLVLSALGLLGSLELLGERAGSPWSAGVCALASAGIALWALRRYLFLLGHAQRVADQAVCPGCRAYARWDIEEDPAPTPRGAAAERLRVRCRACRHTWHIVLS